MLFGKYYEEELRLNINLFEEMRELALIREHNYKTQLQKYYDSRVQKCNFDAGEFIFRNNETLGEEPLGKLAPTWEGPTRSINKRRLQVREILWNRNSKNL